MTFTSNNLAAKVLLFDKIANFVPKISYLCRTMSDKGLTIAIRALVALAVGLLLCACGGRKEMSNQVIVQNEQFTVTADSIIEDTVVAWIPKSNDRIASNLTLARLDSMYGQESVSPVSFVQGRAWRLREKRPTMMPEFKSGLPMVDMLYNMSVEQIADAIDRNGHFIRNNNYSHLRQ